jgi:hypothetical protein
MAEAKDSGRETREVTVTFSLRVSGGLDNRQLAERLNDVLGPYASEGEGATPVLITSIHEGGPEREPNGYDHRLWEKTTC